MNNTIIANFSSNEEETYFLSPEISTIILCTGILFCCCIVVFFKILDMAKEDGHFLCCCYILKCKCLKEKKFTIHKPVCYECCKGKSKAKSKAKSKGKAKIIGLQNVSQSS